MQAPGHPGSDAYPSAPIVVPLTTRSCRCQVVHCSGSGNSSPSALMPSLPTTAMLSTSPSSAAVSDRTTTVAGVAGRIGAHEPTLRGGITSGEFKAAKFGTRIGFRIKCSDYEEFLRRRTLTGAIAAHLLQGASAAPDS